MRVFGRGRLFRRTGERGGITSHSQAVCCLVRGVAAVFQSLGRRPDEHPAVIIVRVEEYQCRHDGENAQHDTIMARNN